MFYVYIIIVIVIFNTRTYAPPRDAGHTILLINKKNNKAYEGSGHASRQRRSGNRSFSTRLSTHHGTVLLTLYFVYI